MRKKVRNFCSCLMAIMHGTFLHLRIFASNRKKTLSNRRRLKSYKHCSRFYQTNVINQSIERMRQQKEMNNDRTEVMIDAKNEQSTKRLKESQSIPTKKSLSRTFWIILKFTLLVTAFIVYADYYFDEAMDEQSMNETQRKLKSEMKDDALNTLYRSMITMLTERNDPGNVAKNNVCQVAKYLHGLQLKKSIPLDGQDAEKLIRILGIVNFLPFEDAFNKAETLFQTVMKDLNIEQMLNEKLATLDEQCKDYLRGNDNSAVQKTLDYVILIEIEKNKIFGRLVHAAHQGKLYWELQRIWQRFAPLPPQVKESQMTKEERLQRRFDLIKYPSLQSALRSLCDNIAVTVKQPVGAFEGEPNLIKQQLLDDALETLEKSMITMLQRHSDPDNVAKKNVYQIANYLYGLQLKKNMPLDEQEVENLTKILGIVNFLPFEDAETLFEEVINPMLDVKEEERLNVKEMLDEKLTTLDKKWENHLICGLQRNNSDEKKAAAKTLKYAVRIEVLKSKIPRRLCHAAKKGRLDPEYERIMQSFAPLPQQVTEPMQRRVDVTKCAQRRVVLKALQKAVAQKRPHGEQELREIMGRIEREEYVEARNEWDIVNDEVELQERLRNERTSNAGQRPQSPIHSPGIVKETPRDSPQIVIPSKTAESGASKPLPSIVAAIVVVVVVFFMN